MLRKSRSHYYGFTNIDLRSKGDPKVLSLYQPWMVPKDFGTMGSANFKLPPDSHKSIFKVSNQLNSFQEKNLETPNPKYYSSCKYYQDNKLKINQKTSLVNERASQLDESVKGKEPFIGDSMMISDNIKIRKINKIKKGFGRKEKRSKLIRNENIIKEKKKQLKLMLCPLELFVKYGMITFAMKTIRMNCIFLLVMLAVLMLVVLLLI